MCRLNSDNTPATLARPQLPRRQSSFLTYLSNILICLGSEFFRSDTRLRHTSRGRGMLSETTLHVPGFRNRVRDDVRSGREVALLVCVVFLTWLSLSGTFCSSKTWWNSWKLKLKVGWSHQNSYHKCLFWPPATGLTGGGLVSLSLA